MLHEYLEPGQLLEAETLTRIFPDLLEFNALIRNEVSKIVPEIECRIFSSPYPKPKLWLLARKNEHACCDPVAPLEFRMVLPEFLQRAKNFTERRNEIVVFAPKSLQDQFRDFVAENMSHYLRPKSQSTCYRFYMDEMAQARVLDTSLKLPEGYHFHDVVPEVDGAFIHGKWAHAREAELPQTLAYLRRMPSAAVKYGEDLVAFEICDPSGVQNHLYTVDEHRGRGLGKAVELRLCQEAIRRGIWPLKANEISNKAVVEASNRSPFWRLMTWPNGDPFLVEYNGYSVIT